MTATRDARSTSVRLALLALALGGFAIGTTEYVTMGLLPDVAHGISASIPRTGNVISAYAFGVVVGAPLIVSLAARLPKRGLVAVLALVLGLGNAATALAHGYWPMMAARFLAGLPHGAYFGVATLIASSLVAPEFRGRAVSSVMLGLSVATVAGVPAGTWLGQHLGWRSAYWAVVAITIVTAALIMTLVPRVPADEDASPRRELAALRRPQVLYAVAAGMVGFGGLFAMYTYIAPIVTGVAGLSRSTIPWFLLAFGIGSVVGTFVAGRLADWNVERSVLGGFAASIVTLIAFAVLADHAAAVLLLLFTVSALGSVLAINLQVRLMSASGEARMLGAALNHSALNLANGLGASLGSVVIAAGLGYRAPSIVGGALAAGGLVIFLVGLRRQHTQVRPQPVPQPVAV